VDLEPARGYRNAKRQTQQVVLTINLPSSQTLTLGSLTVGDGQRLYVTNSGTIDISGNLILGSQSEYYKTVNAGPINANCAVIPASAILGIDDTTASLNAGQTSTVFVQTAPGCSPTYSNTLVAKSSASSTCYTVTSQPQSGQIGFTYTIANPQPCSGAVLPAPTPAPAQDLGWVAAVVIVGLLLIAVIVVLILKRDKIKEKFSNARNTTGVTSTPQTGNRETATEIPAPPFTVTSIADYTAVDTTQMSLTKGVQYEVVRVAEGNYWFQSKKPNGKLGWFPASYARIESD